MKTKLIFRILISGSFMISVQGVSAQGPITITKANVPVAGQNIIYSTSNDSIDVSKTGANITWDFSNITPVAQDTYKYVAAKSVSALDGATFKGDVGLNVKTAGFKGAYQFYKTATVEYTMAGIGITIPMLPFPISIVYTSPDVIYHFPLTYGDTDSASFFALTPILSIDTAKIAGKRINVVDGWGKVITPYKTYKCIRVKSFVKETDSILGTGVDNSRIEYKWLSTAEQIPVFEAVVAQGIQGIGNTMILTYRDSFRNVVNPNGPVVEFDVPDTNVYTKDTVTVNNTTTGALTYSWVITPSSYTYVSGTSSTTKNPKLIFSTPGLYTVSLNATGIGGSNYLTRKNYINATHDAGMESISNVIGELKIYPNPTSGDVLLNMGDNRDISNCRLSVINASGKTVYISTVNSNNGLSDISMKDCAPGLYLIIIQSGPQVFEGRVVKN